MPAWQERGGAVGPAVGPIPQLVRPVLSVVLAATSQPTVVRPATYLTGKPERSNQLLAELFSPP